MKQYVSPARIKFYHSRLWQGCREAYLKKQRYICERCGGTARIVHHKEYITDENLYDPDISLNEDNLEALCMDCHNKEHNAVYRLIYGRRLKKIQDAKDKGKRFYFDENGKMILLDDPPMK